MWKIIFWQERTRAVFSFDVISLVLAVVLLISLLAACSKDISFTVNFVVDGVVVHTIETNGNEEITMPSDPKKTNFIFDGWYQDKDVWENLFTAKSLLDTPLSENLLIYANWKAEEVNEGDKDGENEGEKEAQKYSIRFISNGGSDVSDIIEKAGEKVTEPAAPTFERHAFGGWYTDNNTFKDKFTFNTMPTKSCTLYAKWTVVAYSRINASGEPTVDGNYILFGEYPQTIKADDVTITEETDHRGYYLGSDNYYYAKVTAAPNNSYKFSTGTEVSSDTVYYFKVEFIKWRILEESDGTALILCESIIANMRYAENSNNYMNSEIRAWLNEELYAAAFYPMEQELIQLTEVDNSVYSTGHDPNQYSCDNTYDMIFLPSYREMVNTSYGFDSTGENGDTARTRLTSDYSRATGVSMKKSGIGFWWLRSPDNYKWNDVPDSIVGDHQKGFILELNCP